jgi:competence protein ComEC
VVRVLLYILDVGHGNCAVLVDTEGIIVIDAGHGSTLLEFLKKENIKKINHLLISHSDKDHIEGVIALLASGEIKIDSIKLNSDAQKGSKLWDDLLYSLDNENKKGTLRFEVSLTPNNSKELKTGTINTEVLAPSTYLAAKGPGAVDKKRRKITVNTMSAVIRLLDRRGNPIALFPSDIDEVGLFNLIESGIDMSSLLLVFPHHGGKPGDSDIISFTKRICNLVKPNIIVFSIARDNRYMNPHPEIINTIQKYDPHIWIACTQLSKRCATAVPNCNLKHLNKIFAQGSEKRKCCTGSIIIDLSNSAALSLLPDMVSHTKFIKKNIPMALCKQKNK